MRLVAAGMCPLEIRVGVGGSSVAAQKVMVGNGTGADEVWRKHAGHTASRGQFTLPQGSWTDTFTYVVHGCGRVNVSARFAWGQDVLQWQSFNREVRILLNGNQIAHQSWSGTTSSWIVNLTPPTQNLHHGDVIVAQGYVTGTGRESARNMDESSILLVPLV